MFDGIVHRSKLETLPCTLCVKTNQTNVFYTLATALQLYRVWEDDNSSLIFKYRKHSFLFCQIARGGEKQRMYTLASIINFIARYEKLYGYIFMKNTGSLRSCLPH